MKKFGVMLAACGALAACGSDNSVVVMGQKCDKIATGERGDILVKCPVIPEMEAVQAATADSMFLSVQTNLEEVAADAEHIYVNIIPANTFEGQATTCYRVMVKNPVVDGEAMYSVQICEEPVAEEVPATEEKPAEEAPADAE